MSNNNNVSAQSELIALFEDLKNDLKELKNDLKEVNNKIDNVNNKIDNGLKEVNNKIDNGLKEVKNDLKKVRHSLLVQSLQQKNSLKTRTDKPEEIPKINKAGELEFPGNSAPYPEACGDIITAGNEKSAGPGKTNAWSAKKSLKLINFYDPGYQSDEDTPFTSRRRRITVAKYMGITTSQLSGFEQSILWE